jgi:hypothetical protein
MSTHIRNLLSTSEDSASIDSTNIRSKIFKTNNCIFTEHVQNSCHYPLPLQYNYTPSSYILLGTKSNLKIIIRIREDVYRLDPDICGPWKQSPEILQDNCTCVCVCVFSELKDVSQLLLCLRKRFLCGPE